MYIVTRYTPMPTRSADYAVSTGWQPQAALSCAFVVRPVVRDRWRGTGRAY